MHRIEREALLFIAAMVTCAATIAASTHRLNPVKSFIPDKVQ